jgi:hypothetical protein
MHIPESVVFTLKKRLFIPGLIAALCFLSFRTPATTFYVDAGSTNAAAPFTDWSTAAATIQDALDLATDGDLVLVTNGIYDTGGFAASGSNRVYLTDGVTVRSVNGPTVTIIQGYQVPDTTNGLTAVRCAYVNDGAILSGFTLTNGATLDFNDGGGVNCTSTNALITNCVVVGNAATLGGGSFSGTLIDCVIDGNHANQTGWGGGVLLGHLVNCLVIRNGADYTGGGIYDCTAINCTIVSNTAAGAVHSGGAAYSILKNCVDYYNLPDNGADNAYVSSLTNCCTTPLPVSGANNDTNAPQFVDSANGNFRLQPGSPGIDSGDNTFNTESTDLDGNPRVAGSAVDMGAYELQPLSSPVHFVNADNLTPVSPYATWATAATNIQDAIDVAIDGEEIVVTNGIYQTGGRVVYGSLTNRVVVDKAVSIRSVNGPDVTIIRGFATNSDEAVRCIYLTNGAVLAGFTLSGGGTRSSGDVITEQSGGGAWCESSSAVISNCVVLGNSANIQGGGAMRGTLIDCTLSSNSVPLVFDAFASGTGGGAHSSVLNHCLLTDNSAGDAGGGAFDGVLNDCTLAGNIVNHSGGAAQSATLNGCTLFGNSSTFSGGGAETCTLNFCTLSNNSSFYGGGADTCTITDCVLSANTANNGGGALNSTLVDCTLSGNSTFDSEAPGAGGGGANCSFSNCVFTANFATFGGGAQGSSLESCILTGNSGGDFGGGAENSVANNSRFAGNSAASSGGGASSCSLTSCTLSENTGYSGGGANGGSLQNCVISNNAAAVLGGGLIGSSATNCVIVGNTGSEGGGAKDCVLDHCRLSNNTAILRNLEGGSGGGAFGGALYNCLLISNSVANAGGGIALGTAENCIVTGNSSTNVGGGAYKGTLNNCAIIANSAIAGGGTSDSDLNNCVLYFNSAAQDANFTVTDLNPTLNFCCTTPLPTNGVGNFTNIPVFVDLANGDFHPATNSPVINAGGNGYVTATVDLDGNPRIVGGPVDVGPYEFQAPGSIISYAWLQQYGLATDGSADFIDSDGDTLNNWQEWRTGTSPTDPASVLQLISITSETAGINLTWQSGGGINYFLERASDLSSPSLFSTIATNLPGQPGTTTYTDTNATGTGPFFYRVGVQLP